tara:strand:+ start:1342 stop:1932 length:591 start_codon:yes stop_codon:yes gene_type:complete
MKKNTLVLASNNEHKILEIKDMLGNTYQIIKQADFNIGPIPETGKSFKENAIIKAREVHDLTGLTTIGDDSGLVVEALDGEPGVLSARYSGINATDEDNNGKLLKKLEETNTNNRNARFECVIALIDCEDPKKVYTFSGTWKGKILLKKRGSRGFGYDPLFFDPKIGKSSAELSIEQKNKISHRAKALARLKQHIL